MLDNRDKTGKWVLFTNNGDIRWAQVGCSLCKRPAFNDNDAFGWFPSYYCPHCGAKMDFSVFEKQSGAVYKNGVYFGRPFEDELIFNDGDEIITN